MEDVRSFLLSLIPEQAKPFEEVLQDLSSVTSGKSRGSAWDVDLTPDEHHRVCILVAKAREHQSKGDVESGWFYLVKAQETVAYRQGMMEAEYESSETAVISRTAARNGAAGGRASNAEVLAIRQRVTSSILAIHSQKPFRFTADMRDAIFDLEDGKGRDNNWFRRTLSASPELKAIYGGLTKKSIPKKTKAGH